MRSRAALGIVVFALCVICLCLFADQAYAAEYDGFIYEVHDGMVTITGCTMEEEYFIDIPQTIEGYPVVSIGAHAFEDFVYLIDVTIPEGVQTIESYAFYQCYNLTYLTLPNSLLTIEEQAFCSCSSLLSLEFGDNLFSIGYGAFSFCKKLDYLDFPNSMKIIGGGAFYDCDSLRTVLLPSSLTELGSKAFAMCNSLDYIYIPDGVTKIGSQVLYQSACYYDSQNWYGDVFYIWPYLLEAKKSISGSCTILEGVSNLADGAFENCYNLTDVILPDSLRIIGASAFEHCDQLQRITIPAGVTTIEDKAFYECTAATDIQCPASVIHLGENVFTKTGYYNNSEYWDNNALYVGDYLISCKSSISGVFQVREGTKYIASGAMKGLTRLTELILPDTVIEIGYESAAGCTSLTKVTIPNSVRYIKGKAFYGCSALKTVYFGNAVAQIDGSAFGQCPNLESIAVHSGNETYHSIDNCVIRTQDKCLVVGCKTSWIPHDGSVTSIGDYAFEGRAGFTEITIPDSVLAIGDSAFEDCDALTTVSLGNGVKTVGKRAFASCESLSQIDLGQSVHTIDDFGFAYNPSITYVEFPASLRYLGEEAFSNCAGLVSTYFHEGILGIGKNCFYCCENLTSLHLPDSLDKIDDGAFYYCVKIDSLVLGDGLTSIGDAAFMGCEALTTLTIPNNVHTIGSSAFYECTKLQQVDLGQVKKIDSSAFEACSSLTQIHIPASVTSIGLSAFSYCPSIESMTVSPYNQYYSSKDNCIINKEGKYVAFGCKNSIIPDDGSITAINGYAFAGCKDLKSIVIPNQVTTIYACAFMDCSGLKEMQLPFIGGGSPYNNYLGYIFGAQIPSLNDVYVPNSLERLVITGGTAIGDSAFINCRRLKEIIFPETVTSIGYQAFKNCSSLQSVVIPGDLQKVKETNIFSTAPNAWLYISAGQANTKEYAQKNGVFYRVGGLITFTDEQGQCIDKVWYSYGEQIVTPNVPKKPADQNYSYTISWDPFPGVCTGNQTIQLHFIAKDIHSWDSGTVTKQPSCRENGIMTFTCTECNATKEEKLDKTTDHHYVEWYEIVPNSCTQNGIERHDCENCGYYEYRDSLATGHSYYAVVTESRCTEFGYSTYICSCGDSYTDLYTDPLGHDLGDWVTVREPDYLENGLKMRYCSRCETCATEEIPNNPFEDVAQDNRLKKEILWAYYNGITSGVTATTFEPNTAVNRGQAVTFLWRAAGCPEPESENNPFVDVGKGAYYYKAILWAVEQGITNGTTATTFSPQEPCKRRHIAMFLYRWAGEPEVAENGEPFPDVNPNNTFYKAVLWAAEEGITKGTSQGTFDLHSECTRAQVVTFLYRGMEK